MITLRNVLRVNALTSGFTGLLLTVVPGFFRDLFGVNSAIPFVLTGIFLITFASAVAVVSFRPTLQRVAVVAITITDSLWVVGSIVFLVMPVQMSMVGKLLTLALAAWVMLMAILQHRGLRGAAGNPSHPSF